MTGDYLRAFLARHRFRFTNEAELQTGLATAFSRAGLIALREVAIGDGDRIDFFFLPDPGLGLEVKIQGNTNAVLRQLGRYAESDRVRELVLVTSRLRLASAMPVSIVSKPLTAVCLEGSAFG